MCECCRTEDRMELHANCLDFVYIESETDEYLVMDMNDSDVVHIRINYCPMCGGKLVD